MPFQEWFKDAVHAPIAELGDGKLTLASILIGCLILVVARGLSYALERGIKEILEVRGVPIGTRFAARRIVTYVVMTLATLVAMGTVGFDLGAIVAASAALFVGIGLGLQTIATNFISGVVPLIERPVRKGDFVQVGELMGTVEDIGLRATQILTRDQMQVIVPNSHLINERVVNCSAPETHMRIAITVGVAYGSDTRLVEKLLLEVAVREEHVMDKPVPEVQFRQFGNSSLDFVLLVWINESRQELRIASRLRFQVDKAFRDNGVTIPFPQRDLHLKSGFEKS